MGSEQQPQQNTTPTLSLFTLPHLKPHQHHHHHQQQQLSTNFTSPLHTSASVPFRWEEQPGKPLPFLALSLPSTKCLDLPPRLLNDTHKFSPTTVLDDGPYNIGVKSYSFSFLRKTQGSFDGSLSGGSSPQKGLPGPILLSRSSSSRSRRYNKGLFSSWRIRGYNNIKCKNDVNGGKLFSPHVIGTTTTTQYHSIEVGSEKDTADTNGDTTAYSSGDRVPIKVRKGNFLGLSPVKNHFLAAIYGAFKQVIPSPRRSTKLKKDAC